MFPQFHVDLEDYIPIYISFLTVKRETTSMWPDHVTNHSIASVLAIIAKPNGQQVHGQMDSLCQEM